MKKTLHLMLVMALILCNINVFANTDEDEVYQVTLGTGTTTDHSTPFVTRHCYSWNETIYHATEIGGACTIEAISYHNNVTDPSNYLELEELSIYMAVSEKLYFMSPADWTPADKLIKVYSGENIILGDTPWEKIKLDIPFYYNGKGNLIVVVAKKTSQFKPNCQWYYTESEYNTNLFYGNDKSVSIAEVPPTTSDQGTRTTWYANIMLDVVYGEVSSPIIVSPNPIDLGHRPAASWTRPAKVDFSTESKTSYILGIESLSPSFMVSNFEAPAEVSKDNPFSVSVKLTNSNVVGDLKGKIRVTNNYDTDDIEIRATTYSPVSPDVWEKAEEVSSYPYNNTPDFDNLYDNYFLPGEVADGPDAVYRLAVEEPTTLSVGVNGENAKIALYAENFNGKGGPDVDNYYGAVIDPDHSTEPEFPEVEKPVVQGNTFSFDFNDGSLEEWRTIDVDGDRFNWGVTSDGNINVGNDVKCLYSLSYNANTGSILTPDNYIVTKGSYTIDRNSVLEFDVRAFDEYNYTGENYAVVVSLDGVNFETILEETFTNTEWQHKKVSLANYAAQDIVIGFRHFVTSSKRYAILVDNAVLKADRGSRYVAAEKYTVPAGVYYLAVSATERFTVNINATTENGFNPVTEVLAEEIDDNSINLKWSWDFINNGVVLGKNKSLNNNTREDGQKAKVLGYNVYRRNTLDNGEAILIAEDLTDTLYVDNTWKEAAMGLYQWGVSVIYDDNNGGEYETPVAYSNTIGKDMFTTFDVIVDTENAASAAGTKVSLFNVYEPSFKYEVTLDESGKYHWDSFRKGTYRYSMSLDGFKQGPQNELVEVWDESKLEYTFEEIFIVGDIFVSTTGWAMWNDDASSYQVKLNDNKVADVSTQYYQFDEKELVKGQEYTTTIIGTKELKYTWTYNACDDLVQATDFEVNTDGKDVSVSWTLPVKGYTSSPTEFMFDFEDETLNGWMAIDADGDKYTWSNSKNYSQTECGYQSWYSAMSHSCMEVTPLTPDNYLTTSKKYLITKNSKLHFNVSAENKKYSQEHYGIAISTKTNYNLSDFEMIFEETLPQDENDSFHGTWYDKTIDLSKYAGQEVYIAFRHFNCTNQFWINIDNVQLTTEETRKEEGEWLYYENGKSYDAMGLQGGSSFYWAMMFPASDMQKYAGKSLTKVSMFDITEHEGRFMIYLGGNKAPGTLVHSQDYKAEGNKTYVEYELTYPVEISGEQNVWVVFNNYNGQHVAPVCVVANSDANGRWFSNNGTDWVDFLSYSGYNLTWQIRAFIDEVPVPNPTDTEVVGAMLYRDGELLTESPLTEEEFFETLPVYGDYEYSLRVVYGGEEETYFAMSCPQNITLNHVLKCEAPKNLYAESAVDGDKIGTKLEWPYTLHGTEWLHYDNGIVETALGLNGPSVSWAIMFPAKDLEFYNGTLMTKVSVYDYEYHDGNIKIYYGGDEAPEMLIHSQPYACKGFKEFAEFELTAPIPVDASTNLWIVFTSNNGSYPAPICKDTGNKNGRWMSTDGESWADIGTVPDLAGTFMIRAFVTSSLKGGAPVALGRERNEEAELSHYNVYRGTSLDNFELIAQPTAGYYFDEVEKGTYYYQVTATYIEGEVICESEPANSYLKPEDNFVMVEVTALNEDEITAVKIYPNPTNNNLNISAEGLKHITVFNTLGQIMYDNNSNSDNEVINMSGYDAGIYMIRVTTENGMTIRRVSVVR